METKTCPEGHVVQVSGRVCLTCGWLFPLPEGHLVLGDWQVQASVRLHDRYFYRLTRGDEAAVLAEALEFFQEPYRHLLYADLKPVLDSLGMPILEYAHWQAGSLLFLHTRYPIALWHALQHPLRTHLDQTGILPEPELRSLFETVQLMGRGLLAAGRLNPSLTAYLLGQGQDGQWYFFEWEYCVPSSAVLLFPRWYLGYHVSGKQGQRSAQNYNLALMHSALRGLLLECLTGSSPTFWYPDSVSVTSCKALLSSACLRWLEAFEQEPDPRQLTPPSSFYSSPAARASLQKSCQLFAEGYALYQAGQVQAAYPSFEQATRQHLLFSQGYRFLGLCVRKQDYSLFLRLLEQALRVEPRACFYFERAEGHILHEKVEAAAEDLLKALKNQAYFPEAWFLLGSCQERMRQFSLAEMAYKEALKQCNNPQFNLALAKLYEKQGLTEKAKKYQRSSLRVGAKLSVQLHEPYLPEQVTCAQGHANPPEQGFCLQCQLPLGPETGAQIGEYTLLECLKRRDPGAESYTSVYRAQTESGREVLLKEQFVPPHKREYFLDKYQRLLELQHEYIQNIEAVFMQGPYGYLIYPWKAGQTLQDTLEREGALPEQQVWQVLITIASVIVYLQAHEYPRVHGDIKPANILLTDGGDVLLLDLDSVVTVKPDSYRRQGIATYPYAPPEQLLKERVDIHTDGYALGVTLLACMTGVFPEIFISHHYKRFYKWEERIPHLSAPLKTIVQGLIVWKPEQRTPISRENLRQWLTAFKAARPLPVPDKFQQFQTAFWAVYRSPREELESKAEALLKLETNRVTLFYCASRFVQEGMNQPALRLLRNIQRLSNEFESTLWLLGEVYLSEGYYQAAIEVLNQSLENCKDVYWPYLLLARAYKKLRQMQLALAAYEKAHLHGAPAAIFLEYLSFLLQEQYFVEVRNLAHAKLLEFDLPHERAFLHGAAGMALAQLGCEEDAFVDLQASLNWEPNQVPILFHLGKVCLRLQRFEEAQSHFEQCLKLEPGHRGARFYLARTWIDSKQFQQGLQALLDLESDTQVEAEMIDLLFQKARVLTLLQRIKEAEVCYQELMRLFPCEAVCVNYGNLCLILQQNEKAQRLFEQALGFNSASAEAKHGLKLATAQVG